MKSLWRDVRDIYGSAWAFALACPLLFLVPVLFEFAQHVIEVRIGLYQSADMARALENDGARMMAGYWKTLAISLPSYWMYRYVASGRDAAFARRPDGRALLLWAALFVPLVALMQWLALFGPPLGSVIGLNGSAESWAKGLLTLFQTVVGIYLTAWLVAWSLGNAAIGPLRSVAIMNGSFWRTVALIIAGVVPLMALHYGGLFAIGRPEPLVWAIMVFDAIVVGFLSLTIFGANAIAAMRAAERKGVSLMPVDEERRAAAMPA
ncbi:hypothetical protein GCM10022280_23430 [Sphingomonas swuensis]|uniref:DUF4013 domain-containing protein n=1 Tax=Sphingomonas swuensis TaxID=977800 RepID=A0ABP7T7F8_9SPHN